MKKVIQLRKCHFPHCSRKSAEHGSESLTHSRGLRTKQGREALQAGSVAGPSARQLSAGHGHGGWGHGGVAEAPRKEHSALWSVTSLEPWTRLRGSWKHSPSLHYGLYMSAIATGFVDPVEGRTWV